MTRVKVNETELTAELQDWHRLAAFKRRIQVPLSDVRGATADPGC